MEDVIQKLEEKRGYFQERLKEIEEQIKKLDQALATLQGDDQPPASLDPLSSNISARTPWP